MTDYTFGKSYKLCGNKIIAATYKEGTPIRSFPFVVHYTISESGEEGNAFQVVFSAPKRRFKRAHDRNAIKRLMREGFRLNKAILEERLKKNKYDLKLFVIFTGTRELTSQDVNTRTKKLFHQLVQDIFSTKENELKHENE